MYFFKAIFETKKFICINNCSCSSLSTIPYIELHQVRAVWLAYLGTASSNDRKRRVHIIANQGMPDARVPRKLLGRAKAVHRPIEANE